MHCFFPFFLAIFFFWLKHGATDTSFRIKSPLEDVGSVTCPNPRNHRSA
jgi:hypothetical protein